MRTSKTVSVLAKLAVAIAFVCACNAVLTFALEPYGSKSELSWDEYSKLEAMDTLVIGTSLTEAAINPAVFDEACGTTTFNLGTPYQHLEESLVGIRAAYEDFGIKRVVLGISCSSLTGKDAPSPETSFLKQWRRHGHGNEALAVWGEMLFAHGAASTADSLNWLAPWISNHTTFRPANIVQNMKNKLEGEDLRVAAGQLDEGWMYVNAGHGAQEKTMSPNSPSVHRYVDAEVAEGAADAINPGRRETFIEIVDYCASHGIDLMVASMPMPAHNIVDTDAGYVRVMSEFAQLARERNVEFYDFNCVSKNVFETLPDYYADNTHLNVGGAAVFSTAFAHLYVKRMAGDEIDSSFVSYEEAVASVDSVTAVFVEAESDGRSLTLHCDGATGPGATAEYQVFARSSAESDDWKVVQEWTTEPDIVYEPGGRGTVHLRVCARTVGSTEDFERYRDLTALV